MGPLEGIKILEFAGIGPGPFAAMMFKDKAKKGITKNITRALEA